MVLAFPVNVHSGIWLHSYTYRDSEGDWLTVRGAAAGRFRLPRKNLEHWSKGGTPCRYLLDEKGDRQTIRHQWVSPPTPRNAAEVLVLFLPHVATIANKRGQCRPKRRAFHVDGERRIWLTEQQIIVVFKKYGVTRGLIRTYGNKPSRVRPGDMALRSKTIPNTFHRTSGGEILVYLKQDLIDIIAGNENEHPGTGRGALAAQLRKARDKHARNTLKKLRRDHGPLPSGELFKLAYEEGVSYAAFCRAMRSLGLPDDAMRSASHKEAFDDKEAFDFLKGAKLPMLWRDLLMQAKDADLCMASFERAFAELKLKKVRTGGLRYVCRPGQDVPRLDKALLNAARVLAPELEPYKDNEGTWWPVAGAFEKFAIVREAFNTKRLLSHYLERWRVKTCRMLGRTIRAQEIERGKLGTLWVHHEEDLLTIADALVQKRCTIVTNEPVVMPSAESGDPQAGFFVERYRVGATIEPGTPEGKQWLAEAVAQGMAMHSATRPTQPETLRVQDNALNARNRWMYEQRYNGQSLKAIRDGIPNENHEWETLESLQGVKDAIDSYATLNSLPKLTSRS